MRLATTSPPVRTPSAWVRSAARSSARPDVALALRLQRSIGNRRTCALLRSPKAAHPTPMATRRGEFPQITAAHPAGGLDQQTWSQTLADAKAAFDARDFDGGTALYKKLYQDLATTAGATALKDVAAGPAVNVAKADNTGYAPGLNLVLERGSKGGTTAWVDDAGNFAVPLDTAAKAKRPHVAIRLYLSSFKDDKAQTLGILRHEMLHARHHEQALAALDAGKGAPALSAVDKILVGEVTAGRSRANTELLAYVEGFMTSFHLAGSPDAKHPAFIELLGALDTGSLDTWRFADDTMRNEGLGRLREYYCNTLGAKHRTAFDAWVATLDAQVAKDTAALKAGTDKVAVANANRNVARMFEHFVLGLKEVATCTAPAKAKPARR
jgi:hypothetical protein